MEPRGFEGAEEGKVLPLGALLGAIEGPVVKRLHVGMYSDTVSSPMAAVHWALSSMATTRARGLGVFVLRVRLVCTV